MPTTPRQPSHNRVLYFVVLCLLAAGLAVAYVAWGRHSASPQSSAAPDGSVVDDPARLAAVASGPHVVFINTKPGPGRGRIAIAPLNDVNGVRVLTPLRCERVSAAPGAGVCLGADRGILTKYYAYTFDQHFAAGPRLPLQGFPSRVRVSPDARYAGFTVFVSGDSYSTGSFSTRTVLIDVAKSRQIGELEQFTVLKDGQPLKRPDFNFWGVTFPHDTDRFYVTLGTGGQTYLAEGRISTKTITLVRDGVECPAISPDDRRIVFKSRVMTGGRLTWRLHVYDLGSHAETVVAETRSVDDQAAWLDAEHVLYALPQEPGGTGGLDTWVARADGTGSPQRWLENGYSPAIVTPLTAAR